MIDQRIKVLYVDDENNNLVAFKATFRKDFDIFTANSADEALKILSREEMHVIITDQRMPRVTGVRFLEQAMKLYPDATRMLLTGYSDREALLEAVNKTHIYKCLAKPWNRQELRDCILEGYEEFKRNKESRADSLTNGF